MERFDLIDEEIDEKLQEFKGVAGQFAQGNAQMKDVSQLLLDSSKEDTNPDKETYQKLIKLVGGPVYVICFLCYAQFQKYWDNQVERINAEYGAIDPES